MFRRILLQHAMAGATSPPMPRFELIRVEVGADGDWTACAHRQLEFNNVHDVLRYYPGEVRRMFLAGS